MGNNKSAYRRYTIIDRCFNQTNKKYWTKNELLKALHAQDCNIGSDQLDKDIYAMRFETSLTFQNAPIEYCHKNKAYHYTKPFAIAIPFDDEDIKLLQVTAATLNQYKHIGIFRNFSAAVDKVVRFVKQVEQTHSEEQRIIVLEKAPYLKGYEYLDLIIHAIESRKCINVTYKKFDHQTSYHVKLHPFFVKEFHNRWYVVGYNEEKKQLRTYSLDRIQSIAEDDASCIENTFMVPETYFADCIGINLGDEKIQKVRLKFTPYEANYIKTQHLHSSQQIVSDDEDGLIIELTLIINPELKMQILSYGPNVKVLQPLSLANDIAYLQRKAYEMYLEESTEL